MSILQVENLTKRYPGVVALDHVSFAIDPGEIRGLIGENGAGKSTLSVSETQVMFEIVRALKKDGLAIVYVSHRLEELFELCDSVTVMRDGHTIETRKIEDIDRPGLIRLMVGRELSETYPQRIPPSDEVVLELNNVYGNGDVGISLRLHKGEILGLGGLVGCGRTELAKMIYGAVPIDRGEMLLFGQPIRLSSPADAIEKGIGLIPEDRKTEGVFIDFPIDWNIVVQCLRKISGNGVVDTDAMDEISRRYISEMNIATPSAQQLVKNLSGGNQQKVVVAKVLATQTKVIIFDEPTRGIDVGAKQEIYRLMNDLTKQGISILMISSDMEELLGMSDRIVVLSDGTVAGELSKAEFSQIAVMELASSN